MRPRIINWDDKLDAIRFSYRASKQATTKHSPYFMFGRHPRLPIDAEYKAANSLEDPDVVEPTDNDIKLLSKTFKYKRGNN